MKLGFIVGLFIAIPVVSQTPSSTQNGIKMETPQPVVIGPEHRKILEKSPVARVVIVSSSPSPQGQFKVAVKMTIVNLTGHELIYSSVDGAYDVRSESTGTRAPETPAGCMADFFSECHTGHRLQKWSLPNIHVPPNGTMDLGISYLDADYMLNRGSYDVVGYFCSRQTDVPECIKSNSIRINVPVQ